MQKEYTQYHILPLINYKLVDITIKGYNILYTPLLQRGP